MTEKYLASERGNLVDNRVQFSATQSTLLPMLIGGLVLITLGMVAALIFS